MAKVPLLTQRTGKNQATVHTGITGFDKRFTKSIAEQLTLCMEQLKKEISGESSVFFSNQAPGRTKVFGKLTDTSKKKRQQVKYYPVVATLDKISANISFSDVDHSEIHFGTRGSCSVITPKNKKFLAVPLDPAYKKTFPAPLSQHKNLFRRGKILYEKFGKTQIFPRFVLKDRVRVPVSVSTKDIRDFIYSKFMTVFNQAEFAKKLNKG